MEISSASSSRTTKYPQWQTVVLSGVVTLVVTVCAGILVFYLEARAPRLRYSVVEGIPIIGKSKTTLTYQLAVSNDGKSVAEEVVTRFTVPGATIEQSQVAIDQANEYAMLTSDGDLRLTVPTLNPSEIVRVSLLATSSTAKPPYQISVRGRGLTGTVNATENPSSLRIPSLVIATSTGVLAFMFIGFIYAARRRVASVLTSESPTRETVNALEQERSILVYVLNLAGLYQEASEVVRRPTRMTMWSEADQLTQAALICNSSEHTARVIQALEYLIDYADPASLTWSIVNLNLAKLYLSLDQVAGAKSKVQLAKARAEPVINIRLRQDHAFRDLTEA